MLTKGVLSNGKEIDYAFGLEHGKYRGLKTVRHGGAFKGFRTELLSFPEQHISVVVLCNLGSLNAFNLANGVADIYLSSSFTAAEGKPQAASAVAKPEPVKIATALFDEYVGDYEMAESPGFVFSFTREGDHFYSKATQQDRREIFASSPSEFFHKVGDASFSFHRDADGAVTHLTLHQYGDHEAKRIRPYPLAQSELMDYVGSYYSDELDTSYQLQIEDGKLACMHTRMPRVFLESRSRDTFFADSVQIVFSRDEKGKVTGLRVSSDRVKNLMFRRQEPAL
jgi:hypothetical protein